MSKSKYKAESGHWYTQSGDPMYTIIGANGNERNTNLRDARSLNLVPSVTTIMAIIAKPSLENWKIDQALTSALSLKQGENESYESFFSRCKQDSKKIGKKSAELGTKIHAQIEKGFLGTSTNKPYKAVKKILDTLFDSDEVWHVEDSFCAKQGYGGKIDLYSKKGIFVDFKTKDDIFKTEKDPKRLVYDEHGMQLSAYAQGLGFEDPERVSLFIDRKHTDYACAHVWSKESHQRHLEMFNSALSYWKFSKKYDPSLEVV